MKDTIFYFYIYKIVYYGFHDFFLYVILFYFLFTFFNVFTFSEYGKTLSKHIFRPICYFLSKIKNSIKKYFTFLWKKNYKFIFFFLIPFISMFVISSS